MMMTVHCSANRRRLSFRSNDEDDDDDDNDDDGPLQCEPEETFVQIEW
jgi:hypothetical protein